jgi:hypothetical protein
MIGEDRPMPEATDTVTSGDDGAHNNNHTFRQGKREREEVGKTMVRVCTYAHKPPTISELLHPAMTTG